MDKKSPSFINRLAAPYMEWFGLTRTVALMLAVSAICFVLAAVYWFFHSGPPHHLTITSGAPGSSFYVNAEKYRDFLAEQGVELIIRPSEGSLENLKRLDDHTQDADIGFVQGGITNLPKGNKIVSLGSITYEPLLVFYRSPTPIPLLSGFAGKKVAIGAIGSGTRDLALQLFALNGLTPGHGIVFSELAGGNAAQALLTGKVDAVFLMADTTSTDVMKKLQQAPDIILFDFVQADGYSRRISYLNKLVFPQGSINFGKNLPPHDVTLLGPTVELLARPSLHPVLSDMLIEAAKKTHGSPSLFKKRGEFPSALEHDFPISADATRYYASGKKFPYNVLPLKYASLVSRIVVILVPLLVIIPSLKLIPSFFRWRMKMRINRWYRELLILERGIPESARADHQKRIADELDAIEVAVNRMKVPASFADQFYGLRGHIQFVRSQLIGEPPPPVAATQVKA